MAISNAKRTILSEAFCDIGLMLISSNIALEVTARFLLQAILGSDHMRELYSLIRLWDGQEEPSMLFRPPDVSEKKVRPKKYATDDDVPF